MKIKPSQNIVEDFTFIFFATYKYDDTFETDFSQTGWYFKYTLYAHTVGVNIQIVCV